jgi:hypothetical protein
VSRVDRGYRGTPPDSLAIASLSGLAQTEADIGIQRGQGQLRVTSGRPPEGGDVRSGAAVRLPPDDRTDAYVERSGTHQASSSTKRSMGFAAAHPILRAAMPGSDGGIVPPAPPRCCGHQCANL